jgi:hypothetical protein
MTAAHTLLDRALELAAIGCSIIPCSLDQTPMLDKCKSYQTASATSEHITTWATTLKPSAWAIVSGTISDRIVVDFDGEKSKQWLDKFGWSPHVQSGSGGFHVHLVHPGTWVKTMNAKSTKNWPWPGVDIRGDGGYAVTIGRNSNGVYRQLRDFADLDPFDLLPSQLRQLVLKVETETTTQYPPKFPRPQYESTSNLEDRLVTKALEMAHNRQGRNNCGFWLACQLRDNGYACADAYGVMRRYAGACPRINIKGKVEAYTDAEVRASLNQAFSVTAREPWGKVR